MTIGSRIRPALVAALTMAGMIALSPVSATSDFAAARVLGQPDFISIDASSSTMNGPQGAFVDPAGHILVSDTSNNRVLIWNDLPGSNGSPPDLILGQAALDQVLPNRGGSRGAETLACPIGVWSDGDRVIIADHGNLRVLIWNGFFSGTPSTGVPADLVLGQPDLTTGPALTVNPCAPTDPGVVDAFTFRSLRGVTSDGVRLFVTDTANNRVLEWYAIPTINGTPADLVLGQASMSGYLANRSTSNKSPPAAADTFDAPSDVLTDGARLYVADRENHRVLIWNSVPGPGDPHGKAADVVIGQRNMQDRCENSAPCDKKSDTDAGLFRPSARTLKDPMGLSISAGYLLIGDTYNHRVLVYYKVPTTNFASAQDEIGHGRFTLGTTSGGDRGLNLPIGVHVDIVTGRIFVADFGHNRVTVYHAPFDVSGATVNAEPGPGPLELTVSWTPVADATGYRVYRDGFWYTTVSGGLVTSFVDTMLSPDAYSYTIAPLSDLSRVESRPLGTGTGTAVGSLPPLVVVPHATYSTYLSEGDSTTDVDDPRLGAPMVDLYPLQLGHYLAATGGTKVVHQGLSGSTCNSSGAGNTLNLKPRIQQEIAQHHPDLVTIGVGLNEVRSGYMDTMGGIPIAVYRQCIQELIQVVSPGPNRTLLLLNFTHLTDWGLRAGQSEPDRGSAGSDAKRRAWAKALRDAAAHGGVPLVDVISAMDAAIAACGSSCSETFLLADRLHPNQIGHDIVGDTVLAKLLQYYSIDPGGPAPPGHPQPPAYLLVPASTPASALFQWTPSSDPLRSSDPYEIQYSKSPTFSSGVTTAFSSEPQISLELGSGRWYVRVKAIGSNGLPSTWALSGRVVMDLTNPTTPGKPTGKLGNNASTAQPVWEWTPSVDAPGESGLAGYEVCWANVQIVGGDINGCAKSTTNNILQPVKFSAGMWNFKVRAYDYAARYSEWSESTLWVSTGR